MSSNRKRAIISLVFCSMIMGSTTMLRCDDFATDVITEAVTEKSCMETVKDGILKTFEYIKNVATKKHISIAGTILLFLAVVRFNSKKKIDEPRYDFSKMSPINLKEFVTQLWYLIDDGLIGQGGSKPYLMSDPNNGNKIYAGKKASPMGLGGKISKYMKPIKKATKALTAIATLIDMISRFKIDQLELSSFKTTAE